MNRASETFSLECNVKGTQWLKLSNITVNEIHKSYCQHEVFFYSLLLISSHWNLYKIM